jgi:predicted transposase/invertase (TIGR01784 family)
MKLLKAKQDYIFKRIFGVESNKKLLIALLNAIFRDRQLPEINDLRILNPFNDKEFEDDKLSVLDIKAETVTGEIINIEMQIDPYPEMAKRTLFYAGKMIVEQLAEGEDYSKLKRTVLINILDFRYLSHHRLHSMYWLMDSETKHLLTDVLEIHFLELPKLREVMRTSDRSVYNSDKMVKWLLFLSGKIQEHWEELAMDEPELKKAMETLVYLSQDKETRQKYELREKVLRDERSKLVEAERRGELRGELKGEQVGIAKGVAEGKRLTAINMLQAGMAPELIAQLAELSVEEVAQLAMYRRT